MGDNAQTIQQASMTLWYRPIQAIKFGLQYSYAAANYFAYAIPVPVLAGVPVGLLRLTPLTGAILATTIGWSSSGSSTSNLKIG